MRLPRFGCVVALVALLGANCSSTPPTAPDGSLVLGTWGGENVALIVEDEVAHIHIGCTNGDFAAPLMVDGDGRIRASGSYQLRAYPIVTGPPVPAQLAGTLVRRQLTFTIAVDDTVEKKLVMLGPVTVKLGEEPRLGPCPICVRKR